MFLIRICFGWGGDSILDLLKGQLPRISKWKLCEIDEVEFLEIGGF